ncbi:MAG: hypothetical protein ACR2M9_02785 [Cyanophyceae cyanobacterium]
MAKQATAKKVEVAPQPKVEAKKVSTPVQPAKPKWEIKDRTYVLTGNISPLTLTIPSKHTRKHSLLFFDEEAGEQKEIRYATNHSSVFKKEQEGEATLGHIVFKDGSLTVPKQKQNLQKLLSLYHPLRGRIYTEFSPVKVAENELDLLNSQIQAMNAAKEMDIDHAEAILRVELGSTVSKMSSKELKRDLLLFARSNPDMFIELANDDNVQLRNFAIRASEAGVIKLSQDQRTFAWGSNGRKLMNVPFDENPFSAFAAFLKTDEGVEIYRSIEKNL